MSELVVRQTTEVVRTVDVIAAEINALTATMLSNVIEIGRRMVEAKELLPHGQFGPWLKANTPYSTSTASNYMRLFEAYGSPQKSLFGAEVNCQTFGNLSYSKALALLEVPAEQRESFVKENDVESMSTRELQRVIKERDEALRQAEEARAEQRTAEQARAKMEEDMKEASALLEAGAQERKELQEKLKGARDMRDEMAGHLRERTDEVKELRQEIRELQDRPVEVAVEPDPAAIDAAVKEALAKAEDKHKADLAKMQAELDKEVRENNKLEKKISTMKKSTAEEDKAERLRLEEQVAQLNKQLVQSTPEVMAFRVQFGAWQHSYQQMMKALEAIPAVSGENLRKAILAQMDAWDKQNRKEE